MLKNQNFSILASAWIFIALFAFALSSASHAAGEQPLPDMALGNPDAPVTIIEYSSLSCPHCAMFHKEVFPELKKEYIDTGKARYVMREFPLDDTSLAGAVIARCLPESRYFAFADLLFSKQAGWAFKEDALTPIKALAMQAGMNGEEFNKCIDNEELQKKILAVREDGQKKGVNATPSFFINGTLLKETPTLENFTKAMKPYLRETEGPAK